MNFGRLYELIDRLKANETERDGLLREIASITGTADDVAVQTQPSEPVTGSTPGKATARRTPGDLKPLVLKILGGFKQGKDLDEILQRVHKTRPATRKAALGAVLAGLVSKGLVTRSEDDFQLVVDATVTDAPKSETVPMALDFPPNPFGGEPTTGDAGEALEG